MPVGPLKPPSLLPRGPGSNLGTGRGIGKAVLTSRAPSPLGLDMGLAGLRWRPRCTVCPSCPGHRPEPGLLLGPASALGHSLPLLHIPHAAASFSAPLARQSAAPSEEAAQWGPLPMQPTRPFSWHWLCFPSPATSGLCSPGQGPQAGWLCPAQGHGLASTAPDLL